MEKKRKKKKKQGKTRREKKRKKGVPDTWFLNGQNTVIQTELQMCLTKLQRGFSEPIQFRVSDINATVVCFADWSLYF